MKKTILCVTAALALFLQPGMSAAQGWEAAPLGEDLGTIAIHFGQVMPTTTFEDGSTHESGFSFGASASWWAFRYLGLRASAFRAETNGIEGDQFSAVAEYDPVVYIYGVELAARYPMQTGNIGWAPYVALGPAGKSYRWAIDTPRHGDTDWGWNGTVGLDIRPTASGNIGVLLEARNHRSQYKWHGLQEGSDEPVYQRTRFDNTGPDVSDWVISLGIALHR